MDPSLTGTLRETLSLFEDAGVPWTTTEVADRLDLGRRSTYDRLDRLVERGRLETKKVGARGRVWWRPVTPPEANPEPDAVMPTVEDVLEDVNVGVFVLDEDFEVVWINDATERYFGLDRETVVGEEKRTTDEERIAPVVEDGEAFRETVVETYDDNTYAERFECHVVSGEAHDERRLEHRSRPIESGAYAGGRIELYYDVTEHTRLKRAHEETREELDSLVDAVEEYAIFSLDPEGRVRTWNAGAERIKGYEAEEITGEHFSVFYTEEDRAGGVPEENLSIAAEDGSVEDEGWRRRADGSTFWADVTITAVRDDEGELEGFVKVTRDMTERKHTERERELLYETTRAIAEAETVEAGLEITLESVCEVTDWQYAEAWLPTDDGELERADADYYDESFEACEAFAAFSEDVTFDPGEGLPGRVWTAGESEWARDLSSGTAEEHPRLEAALDAGMGSSFGVPIVADGDAVAVLTFLMPEYEEDDERLVETIESVASELGVLVTRRRLEARIERERDLVDRILDTSPVGIMVLDGDGEYTRINDRAMEILGINRGEAESYTPADRAIYDADGNRVAPDEHPASRVLRTGESVYDWQARVEVEGNGHRWLSVNAAPVLDADGEVEQVITTGEDVTRLKEQARRLERQHEALKAELSDVFDRISDGFFGLDSDLRFTFVNDRAVELLGEGAPFLIGNDIREALLLTETFEAALHEALETQEPVSVEDYYPPLEGWFENRIFPSETGLSVYFRDVTERKERQRALEESRQRYRTLVENFPNGAVALVDADLRYTAFGGTSFEATDVDPEELQGASIREVLPREVADELVPRYEAALAGETTTSEIEVGDRSYLLRTLPVRDDDDDVFAAMGMSQDITERKERERERENRLRQQEMIAVLGQYALGANDVDALFADATELVADTLDADYCKVLELDDDDEELRLLEGVGWDEGLVGSATVSGVETDSQAAYTLTSEEPVVVTDLASESRFSGPDLLTDHGVRSGISVIIGAPDDPWGILGVHDTSPRSYSDHDANFVQAVANVLSAAIERATYERELERQHAEQRERERALRRAYETIADRELSFDDRVHELLSIVGDRLETGYGTLSHVEDDAYVFEVVDVPDGAELRRGDTVPLETTNCERAVETERTLALNDIEVDAPELADRAGNAEWGVSSYLGVPVFVDDEVYGTFCFYDMEARTEAFSEWEVTFVELLSNWVGAELERRQRTERLAALNNLNEVVHEITDAVIDESTREDIETTVCEHLAASDSYSFAWIADVEADSSEVVTRTEAGTGGYLEEVTISVDPDDERGQGPTGRAFRTGEIAVCADVRSSAQYDPWREHVESYGIQSSAAIPIVHEGTVYGVLNLYTDRTDAFTGREREAITPLGEVVGHAIAATERKRALMNDELVELSLRLSGLFASVDVPSGMDGTITIEHLVQLEDDEFLAYGTATPESVDTIEDLVREFPPWHAVTIHSDGDGEDLASFELRVADPPVLSTIVSLGGRLDRVVIEDGTFDMTVHLSPGVDVRRIIDVVEENYPDAEMLSRKQVTRSSGGPRAVQRHLVSELTDRQRTALEVAHQAGFFEWPREVTGEDVAETLDVSAPTFHQHLRKAERAVFETLFSTRVERTG